MRERDRIRQERDRIKRERELNIQVAERVFGWVWRRYWDLDYESPDGPPTRHILPPDTGWLCPPDWVDCDLSDPRQAKMDIRTTGLPEYVSDVAADYAVLELVRTSWNNHAQELFSGTLLEEWRVRLGLQCLHHELSAREHPHLFYQPGDYARAALSVLDLLYPRKVSVPTR